MSGKDLRETVGLLLVVASMVFVGLEIRQNNVALQAAAIQESINVARQQVQLSATNPEIIRIYQKVNAGEAVTTVEMEQFRLMHISFFWGMQGVYRQWVLGVLPEEEWQAWRRVICLNMADRRTREVWEANLRATYVPSFVAEVESCPAFEPD